MQTYETYKHSGIDWLGEIPSHWEVSRIKYLFKEINERSLDGSEDLLSVSQYTGVTRKADKLQDGDLLTNASTLDGYKIVRKRQLVSNIMLAWNGSLAFSDFDGITSPAYCIYELTGDDDYKFFHYLFKTDLYKSEFKRNSSGVIESRLRLYTEDFFNIWSILPPIHEQEAIAAFLDEKCGKIDALVEIKSQQIEKLKELRQVKIHQAVTKGLDEKVELKDSGIDWIGEIPKHWEVKRLKHLLKINNGLDYKHVQVDDGFPVIGSGGQFAFASKYLYDGEVLLLGRKGTIDKPLYFKGKFWTVDTMFYGIANAKGNTKFLYYLATTFPYKYYSTATALPSMTQGDLNNHTIAVPSLLEQEAIVAYLEEITGKIDQAIAQKQDQIEKLKQYKQSLINEVVTGKVKVA